MASNFYNLEGHDIFVGFPEELNMKFNPEDSTDTVFAFEGDSCNICFIAQEKKCTQEEVSETLVSCMKELKMKGGTSNNDTIYSLNGSGAFILGEHEQNSDVNVLAGVMMSLFTDQTLFVMANFTCKVALVGRIMGCIAFKSTSNFYIFDDSDVMVRFPDELKLQLNKESVDASNAGFIGDGTECVMHFAVENQKFSEDEIVSKSMDYLAYVNVRDSTLGRSDVDTVNGKAIIMAGLRDDDSGASLMIAHVTSNISDQTVIIRATYGCDPVLIGKAVGATTFNK